MKNKSCNPLSDTDIQIIGMIDRKLLFPLSREIESDMKSKLQTQAKVKRTERPPKPMNNFMVFRRCLNHVVKKSLPYDGKNLSRVAAHIWKQATNEEKQDYVELTKLLKEQHSKIYPNHIEKRNRKHRFNFVHVHCDKNYKSPNLQISENCGINIITEKQEGNGVSCSYKPNCQIRETGRVNITTERQEQVNETNPLLTYYTPYEYGHTDGLNTLLAQQQYQQNSFYYSALETCQTFYVGDSNAGINGNHINYYANFPSTGGGHLNNCN